MLLFTSSVAATTSVDSHLSLNDDVKELVPVGWLEPT